MQSLPVLPVEYSILCVASMSPHSPTDVELCVHPVSDW